MKLKPFATTTLVCVALFGAYTQLHAQGSSTNAPPANHQKGGMSHEGHMNALDQQLNLTQEQKAKVQAVFEQMRQEMQTAFETAKSNADTRLQTILTPQQFQQLQAMFKQHKPHPNHNGQGENNQGNEAQGGTGNQGGQNQGGSQNKR